MAQRISQRLTKPSGTALDLPKNSRVYVIGHKNPDTDCIASAAGYAAFKQALGQSNVQAACAGLPSARTEFLFRKFSVPMPPVLADVFPRVRDYMDAEPITLSAGQTMLEALAALQKTHRRRVPVADSKGHFQGMVSLFDLAERMVQEGWDADHKGGGRSLLGREVHTSIGHAAEVLQARPLSLFREGHHEDLEVYVAAMSEKSLRARMEERDHNRIVLVTGDRVEIHRMAVDLKIRLLVVTGNFSVDDKLVAQAKQRGVSILVTSYDSATTVRRLKFSTPIETLLQPELQHFLPDETIAEIRDQLIHDREEVFPVLDERGKLVGMLRKYDLDEDPPVRLILVDHNELSQAVDGASEVPIIEILDHHRLGVRSTSTPIIFHNDIVGSTCTLVTEQFRRANIQPNSDIAGILMGGVITDTLMLRSPTSTPRDEAALAWLETCADVVAKDLAGELLSVGSSIATLPPRQVISADMKGYETPKFKLAVAQVEEVGFENFFQHRSELLREMKALRKEHKLDLLCLMVTNIVRETSMLLAAGDKRLLDRLPYTRLDENTFDLPGVLSRKKQLLPLLLKTLS